MLCKLHQWESVNGILPLGYCSDRECSQFNQRYSDNENIRRKAFSDGGISALMQVIEEESDGLDEGPYDL